MTLTASLRSEFLKTKRTSLFYVVLLAALILPFVFTFDEATSKTEPPVNGWDNFYVEGFMAMVFAFLPLFFVLSSALLAQIELRNNTWKQVLASPQLFFDILLAKFVVLQLFGLAFIIVFNLYYILGAGIVDLVNGSTFIDYLDRWPELLQMNLHAYGSTIGISAVCFWLSVRSKNFVAPVGVGLLLWFACLMALEFHWQHIDKYVFAIPFTVVAKKYQDEQLFHQLLSVAYGVVFFTITYVEFLMKRMSVGRSLRKLVSNKSYALDERAPENVSH